MSAIKPPLARLLRPGNWDEFVGQTRLISNQSPLVRALARGALPPLIFHGPPGCGKTALAYCIAGRLNADLQVCSGTQSNVSEIRALLQGRTGGVDAGRPQTLFDSGRPLFLFLDEIHRLAKNQQEVLLPFLEEGGFYFAAATTENPNFVLAKGIVSRSLLLRFEPLSDADLSVLLDRALAFLKKDAGVEMGIPPPVRAILIRSAAGDARRLLNAVELLSFEGDRKIAVTEEMLEKLPGQAVRHDRAGDDHYDVISAFIKSMRGGDCDAVLYWLARLVAAGEDPRFIARRVVICAAEDVGLANPHALVVAQAAFDAVEKIGMPEARIPLAEAALVVARSPKSNSAYEGINNAIAEVEKGLLLEVPTHLRGDPYSAKGYIYPHSHPEEAKQQKYLPKPIRFFHPNPTDRY